MPKNQKVVPATQVSDDDLRKGLRRLFQQYDVDGNGHIDERELWAMLTEVVIASGVGTDGFTEDDATTVMHSLDDDGNGTCEQEELVEWCVSGLKRPAKDRKQFARSSPFAFRLDQFLTACGLLAARFSSLPSPPGSPRDGNVSKKQPPTMPQTTNSPTKVTPVNNGRRDSLAAINQASSTISGACDLLQLQCGLRVLFTHFNVSTTGELNCDGVADIFDVLPNEFAKIKTNCTPEEISEIELSMPNICTRKDAPRVFSALDEDKSGSIEMDEFIQWFVAGSLRDSKKQMAFAAKNAFNLRLTHLLRVVVIIAQKLLPPTRISDFQEKVSAVFISACKKKQEELSPPQLQLLVKDMRSKLTTFECIFSESDANDIFRALDSDGDGTITSLEWTAWILRGAALSFQERTKFSGKSELHRRLCNFLEASCVLGGGSDLLHGLTMNSVKRSPKQLTPEQLDTGLKLLFEQFDTDKSGTIDKNELSALMIDLPKRFYVNPDIIPTSDDVDTVMIALDADASGEIDFSEWKEWILGNRGMNEKEKATFCSQSNSHFRLNGFVDSICKIISEMTSALGDEEELRPGLVEIFNSSSNSDDVIGDDEIFKMISILTAKHPEIKWFDCDMKMAQTINEALDADGNGSVEVEEWVQWILRGASRPAIDRAKFAAHSKTFMLLTKFLEAIAAVARKLTLLSKH